MFSRILTTVLCGMILMSSLACSTHAQTDDKPEKPQPQLVVTISTGYNYEVDGKKYYVHLQPKDKETIRLIKKYKVQTLNTALGAFLNAQNEAAAEADLKPIQGDRVLCLREGYSKITDEEFAALVKLNAKKFPDLKGVPAGTMKRVLAQRDLARPILKDGEFVENEFLIHNVILAYWDVKKEKDVDKEPALKEKQDKPKPEKKKEEAVSFTQPACKCDKCQCGLLCPCVLKGELNG